MKLSETAQKIKNEADSYFLRYGQLKHQEELLTADIAAVRAKLGDLQVAFDAELTKASEAVTASGPTVVAAVPSSVED